MIVITMVTSFYQDYYNQIATLRVLGNTRKEEERIVQDVTELNSVFCLN